MNKMIYDFKTHSLYYENGELGFPTFSLAIDTLELIYELATGKLVRIQGFFPIVNAVASDINLPEWREKDYQLNNIDLSACRQNEVYDLIKKIPESKKYFENISIKFDKNKGIIQVGEQMKNEESVIRPNNHFLCGLDSGLNLKCLYIIPTVFTV